MDTDAATKRTFVVHVGKVDLKYHESPVKAGKILEDAGFKPADEFILEALQGGAGTPVAEFNAGDDVRLDEPHRTHFRAVPRGGGRA